jgi:hypothetical protein
MSALEALAAAKAAGVKLSLDGDGIIPEAPKLPDDVVELLTAVKPDLLRVLEWREAAKARPGLDREPACRAGELLSPEPAAPWANLRRGPEDASARHVHESSLLLLR